MRKLKLDELNRVSVEEFKKKKKIPVIVVLDNVRSMHNVGSVFRTADAFAVEKVYLCGITAQPPHKEIRKTAIGATESVAWEYHKDIKDCLRTIKENGAQVVSIEQTTTSVNLNNHAFDAAKKYAIVLGNEVSGVSDSALALSDVVIDLPQEGTKHSLNVSVCSGIVLWELFKCFK